MTTTNVLHAHRSVTGTSTVHAPAVVASRRRVDGRPFDLVRNVGVLVGLWLAYAAVRGVTAGEWSTALENAERLLRVQDALPLPSETWIQGHALSAPWLLKAANRFYLYVHFPGTALFLTWTWACRRPLFGRVRDALVLVTACALVLHVVFPLAPPRMMPGFVDTGAVFGPSPYALDAASAANQIAAMPSLHVGWALLVAVAAVVGLRSRWRWVLAAHPVVTTAVVVVTANHYWADGLVAVALVVAGWWLAGRLARHRPLDPAAATAVAVPVPTPPQQRDADRRLPTPADQLATCVTAPARRARLAVVGARRGRHGPGGRRHPLAGERCQHRAVWDRRPVGPAAGTRHRPGGEWSRGERVGHHGHRRNEGAPAMTDLTPELGPSATCLNCGAQIAVPADDDAVVSCPDCGQPVQGGWRDHATQDLTNHELLRAFGVRGYLTDVVVVEPGALRCEACGTVDEPAAWVVDDLQMGSNMTDPGVTESAMVALVCSACGEMGRVELKLRGPDASADDRVHAGLLQVWQGQGATPPE